MSKRGAIIIARKIPIKLPREERKIAKCALPFNKSSCPGKTESAVSSSGAPKYVEGMNSRNKFVTESVTIKIARGKGEKCESKNGRAVIVSAEIKFVWSPGISPQIIPKKIPRIIGRMSSRIIL